MSEEWKPMWINWKDEIELLNGIDGIIKELWPDLEMYYTMRGWERKINYKLKEAK